MYDVLLGSFGESTGRLSETLAWRGSILPLSLFVSQSGKIVPLYWQAPKVVSVKKKCMHSTIRAYATFARTYTTYFKFSRVQ